MENKWKLKFGTIDSTFPQRLLLHVAGDKLIELNAKSIAGDLGEYDLHIAIDLKVPSKDVVGSGWIQANHNEIVIERPKFEMFMQIPNHFSGIPKEFLEKNCMEIEEFFKASNITCDKLIIGDQWLASHELWNEILNGEQKNE